jgi:hypothetical protein
VLLFEPFDNGFAEFRGEISEFLGFSSAYPPRGIVLEAIPFTPACIEIIRAGLPTLAKNNWQGGDGTVMGVELVRTPTFRQKDDSAQL